jgi:hypothetical protein
MMIAGGTYGERCHYPQWDQIYGSGLRSAIALADVSPRNTLCSYVPKEWFADVEATLSSLGLKGCLKRTETPITFSYLHTFDRMEIAAIELTEPLLEVEGEAVLSFGMIEGDAKVSGSRVVFDRQSSPGTFQANGSHADSLVQIATHAELLDLASVARGAALNSMKPMDRLREGVIALTEQTPLLKFTLAKDGLGGLILFQGDEAITIPSYAAESYFRIGAGDVIAAAFAHAWGELKMAPDAAADYAARCSAYFVEGPRLPLPSPKDLRGRMATTARKESLRILGIGDFELQALLRTTESWLEHLGKAAVYRTLDPDDPKPPDDVSDLVLVGSRITRSQLDSIAAAAVHPAVVFWPGGAMRLAKELFPGAVIANDYATALYHAMRSA